MNGNADKGVRVAVIGDRSGSVGANSIPALSKGDIQSIADIALASSGGAIQGFVVADKDDVRPYSSVPPMPIAPRCSLFTSDCVQKTKRFRVEQQRWKDVRKERLQAFVDSYEPQLTTRNAQSSNVHLQLTAAISFLNAPSLHPVVLKVVYIVSDLQQRPRLTSPLPALPPDTLIVWINPSRIGDPALLARASIFTSHDAATEYLRDRVGRWLADGSLVGR